MPHLKWKIGLELSVRTRRSFLDGGVHVMCGTEYEHSVWWESFPWQIRTWEKEWNNGGKKNKICRPIARIESNFSSGSAGCWKQSKCLVVVVVLVVLSRNFLRGACFPQAYEGRKNKEKKKKISFLDIVAFPYLQTTAVGENGKVSSWNEENYKKNEREKNREEEGEEEEEKTTTISHRWPEV